MGEAHTTPPIPCPSHPHTDPPSPRLGYDLPKYPHSVIVAHVLKVDIIYLRGLWGQGLVVGGGASCPHSPHMAPTCSSMSPGSMRPSAATAPPFMMDPM